jgi:gamma-glutamyltranspeptidase / glutathione hydrolase
MAKNVQATWSTTKRVARGTGGMVAAQHKAAADVGAAVLQGGGNAVDAAIATSLALAVMEPWMSGLGGGGFLVVATPDGRTEALEFGMVAPTALDPSAYPLSGDQDSDLFGWPGVVDDRNVMGPLSVAVPRQAAGLGFAFERHASMAWRDLCAPAIALADQGLPVGWHTSLQITTAAADLARFEAAAGQFLPGGLPPRPDGTGAPTHLPTKMLAQTLRRLADAGPADLVSGDLARLLVEDVQAAGGVLSLDDLAAHPATAVDALSIRHGDARIRVPGGLTAGPTLHHALELIAGKVAVGQPDAAAYLAWADALLTAYQNRLASLGHAGEAAGRAGCTTHLCVVDARGTMVSLTQTLLSAFGSKILSPRTGILLNNGVMWFDPRPGGPNSLAPGKRPLSNMCPVIATRDGAPWLTIGASGGRRIMPAVMQIASMLIDGRLDLETAFHLPRIDVSGGPAVGADRRLPPEIIAALEARFAIQETDAMVWPKLFACPSAILRDPASGEAFGMTDPMQPMAGACAAATP